MASIQESGLCQLAVSQIASHILTNFFVEMRSKIQVAYLHALNASTTVAPKLIIRAIELLFISL